MVSPPSKPKFAVSVSKLINPEVPRKQMVEPKSTQQSKSFDENVKMSISSTQQVQVKTVLNWPGWKQSDLIHWVRIIWNKLMYYTWSRADITITISWTGKLVRMRLADSKVNPDFSAIIDREPYRKIYERRNSILLKPYFGWWHLVDFLLIVEFRVGYIQQLTETSTESMYLKRRGLITMS